MVRDLDPLGPVTAVGKPRAHPLRLPERERARAGTDAERTMLHEETSVGTAGIYPFIRAPASGEWSTEIAL